jgi:enoyl-CoA hydratase
VHADERIAEIVLCRPEIHNRFDEQLHQELTETVRSLPDHGDLRAVLLTSTGKVFSAGGDFEYMRLLNADAAVRRRGVELGRRLFFALTDLPLPLVVALQGDAIGLGATLVLTADAIVAARSAGIADPHVVVGLVAGDGGCVVWPQAVGMLRAKRHLLTGDRIGADEAYAMGLVTDLVGSVDEVAPTAFALAARMASLPPIAVQGTKRALNRALDQRAGEVLDLAFAYEMESAASADLLEAIAAHRERRPGRYEGV